MLKKPIEIYGVGGVKIGIRECVLEDCARICEINKGAFGYEYPLDKTIERLDYVLKKENNRLFVACAGEKVVGYIHGADYDCTYCAPLKNIMAIAVEERYRGRGAGRALLEAVENWARACGCSGVRLVSGFNRESAHGFYEHCGYRLRKQQKNFIKLF